MLPRSKRLSSEDLTKRPFGQTVFPYGTIKYIQVLGPKIAIVASKRNFHTAPDRNRVRRRMYEVVRKIEGNYLPPCGIVIYPSPKALTAPFADIAREITKALSHSKHVGD